MAAGGSPSVLWRCWLGHVTHKIVSEMTYNVSSGTLNPTVPVVMKVPLNIAQSN